MRIARYHLSLLLLCLLDSGAFGQEFEVGGVLTFERFRNNQPQFTLERSFSFQVFGNKWRFEGRPVESITNGLIVSMAFDGNNGMFEVVSNTLTMVNVATAFTGQIPLGSTDSTAKFAWFAYASPGLINSNPVRRLPPFYSLGHTYANTQQFFLPVQFKLDDQLPHLVKELTFLNDGYLRKATKTGTIELEPYPKPFEKGFTEASYRVDEWKFIGRLHLPAAFTFERNLPSWSKPQSSNNTYLHERVVGKIHYFQGYATRRAALPTLLRGTPIVDMRFEPTPARSTNGLLPTNALYRPKQFPAYVALASNAWPTKVEAEARIYKEPARARSWAEHGKFFACVLALAAGVGTLMWKRREREQPPEPGNQKE